MSHHLRALAIAAMLWAAAASASFAGGMNARVEGPARDGKTYTIRTFACSNPASVRVSAWAEGVVSGERKSLPLRLTAAKGPGVFRFERTWPGDGDWLVRLAFPNPHAPVTVGTIAADGRVQDNVLVWDSDGRQECDARLAVAAK